jgi:flagellar P-ring protein precursor FlgI
VALLNRAILFLVASLLAQTVTAQPAPTPPTPPTPAPGGDVRGTRIKDLVDVAGHRHNALVGYGLVVGLQGQGDGRVSFTSQSISGMLGRLGVRVDPRDIAARNVAAVVVTAELPTFMRPGSRLDVIVSSLGDARTLEGGTLIMTPLQAVDGAVYAVAQGPLQVGGFVVEGAGSRLQKNPTTTARVPSGAVVERAVIPAAGDGVLLALRRPDATTARRLAAKINEAWGAPPDAPVAVAEDAAAVSVKKAGETPLSILERIEGLEVAVDQKARVVISERTGTIVIGENVRLRPAAIAHGGLKVRVRRTPLVAQPSPFAGGNTVRADIASLDAREAGGKLQPLAGAATVEELVAALNGLGVTPRDLIAILQALKTAGALDAEIELM